MTPPAPFEHFDDLSPAETAFIALQKNPREYGRWASGVRKRWMASPAGLLATRKCNEKNKWKRSKS